jgi:hypothetical protein
MFPQDLVHVSFGLELYAASWQIKYGDDCEE